MITNRKIDYEEKNIEYNPANGVSIAEYDTPLGPVEGKAFFNFKDDGPKGSRFIGCEIAELRAKKKMIKRKIYVLREQKKVMETYYDTLQQGKNFNPKTREACHARRFIEHFENEIKYWQRTLHHADMTVEHIITTYNSTK